MTQTLKNKFQNLEAQTQGEKRPTAKNQIRVLAESKKELGSMLDDIKNFNWRVYAKRVSKEEIQSPLLFAQQGLEVFEGLMTEIFEASEIDFRYITKANDEKWVRGILCLLESFGALYEAPIRELQIMTSRLNCIFNPTYSELNFEIESSRPKLEKFVTRANQILKNKNIRSKFKFMNTDFGLSLNLVSRHVQEDTTTGTKKVRRVQETTKPTKTVIKPQRRRQREL